MKRAPLVYVTSSAFKKEEIAEFVASGTFGDGTSVSNAVEIEVRAVSVPERLEVDLEVLVRHEVVYAYEALRVPCVVEHAGLIFEDFESASYPGGLTKPMWNALAENFIEETRSAGRRASAKAVVAYCDGMGVRTFHGVTRGHIATAPRGSRAFYWDTVFIPDDPARPGACLTYAEIVEDPTLGLSYKVVSLSQSAKAMLSCLEYIRCQPRNQLWS